MSRPNTIRGVISRTGAAAATTLSYGDALGLLLSAEGFLLAAVALAVTLAAPNQPRQRKYKSVSADRIMVAAVGVLGLLAVGSVFAWIGLLHDGSFHGFDRGAVGGALMLAIVGMPAIAFVLVMGSKRA